MKPADNLKVISMWSAPRSLSTVLLYSFAQHTRCQHFDEPFLWPYLKSADHFEIEGVEQHLTSDLVDPSKQYASLFSPQRGRDFHYIKNMAYQWMDLDDTWQDAFTHGFLIREPKKMLVSYLKNCASCCAEDFALDKLWSIYQRALESGQRPPIVDADDLLKEPELMLKALCETFEMPFEKEMLHWEPGPLEGDFLLETGWYRDILKSTGYRKYEPEKAPIVLVACVHSICDEMQPFYDKLYDRRLTLGETRAIPVDMPPVVGRSNC
jgi:hypothetical protein